MDLTTPYLPVDIYRYVVAEVSEPADLITLCLVSSCVRHEAERILYRTITIRNLRQLQVWSSVIASSPRLADLIRFLAIPLRMEASADLGIIRNHIHIALKNAINLKHLALRMSKGQEFCVLAWMLFGCSFRLHTLSGETFSFTPDEWWRFLSEQPEIHTWTPGYPITEDLSLMPAGILPNLSGLSLSFSSLLTGFPLRPIERLSFRIWPASTEPDDTASLGRFRDTLIKLTCRIEGRPYSTAPATHLASIASQAPRLTYLNYTGIFAPELVRISYMIPFDIFLMNIGIPDLRHRMPYCIYRVTQMS